MYMRGVMMVIHCVIFIGVNDIPVVVLLLCRRTLLLLFLFFARKDLSFSLWFFKLFALILKNEDTITKNVKTQAQASFVSKLHSHFTLLL